MKQLIPRFKTEKAEDEKNRPPAEFRMVIQVSMKDVSSVKSDLTPKQKSPANWRGFLRSSKAFYLIT
ncbi:MAG: hypothetical protein ACI9FU_000302 [Granulosicoccus sp.]|jgi:hypothetical protein